MRAITHSLLFIFLMLQFSCNPATKEIPGIFQAGFKTIRSSDPSRFYKPNTDTSDYLHYRPIDLDVWYPAQTAPSDTALLFGNILGLLEKRANYYTASKSAAGFTQQLADYLCKGFKCSDPARLLNYRTASYQDAKPAGGKFPLRLPGARAGLRAQVPEGMIPGGAGSSRGSRARAASRARAEAKRRGRARACCNAMRW